MEAIESWANVEFFMLKLYVSLAGGPKTDAAAVFLALESSAPKAAAIEVLVSRRVDEEYQNLYRAIARLVKSRAKARDRLVHWIWGGSLDLPDALLLVNPRDAATVPMIHLSPHILVYGKQDFLNITKDNEELAGFGFDFNALVLGRCNRDELFSTLCREPALREILDRQDAQDRSPDGE